ncbi:hypothetical protein [Lentzea flava]|uniref:Uncharacterized protein n=1 Tax=Lentzea flava TaxID=103732 RepID=A0ABQ2UN55_9PSEU|nr:hypothetical protein [Lentzea flava]MCP2200049.1 hypothetical protein [Lentzea flava]GGU45795.1 hypothetical protein GCM10010178_42830 [Lentzea flava]
MISTVTRWTEEQMEIFFQQYVTTALWSSLDDDGEPLDAVFSVDDFERESEQSLWEDCHDFVVSNWPDLSRLDPGQCGHDFWLSRNGHGTGFWDRGNGAIGDRLHAAAKVYGSVHLWADDNGWVHAE